MIYCHPGADTAIFTLVLSAGAPPKKEKEAAVPTLHLLRPNEEY
jgi:hypothetical protein